MAHQTRIHRRRVYRLSPARYAWRIVRPRHVRVALQALENFYRR